MSPKTARLQTLLAQEDEKSSDDTDDEDEDSDSDSDSDTDSENQAGEEDPQPAAGPVRPHSGESWLFDFTPRARRFLGV